VEGLVMEEQKATRRRRAPRQVWDDAQDELMRAHWPQGGLRAVRPLFPTRPDGSLQKRALVLGLKVANRAPGPSVTQKPESGGFWHVAPDAVSAFMRLHVAAWDHRRMRKEVLMDFLIGHDKALGRLDELREARAA